MRLEVNSNRFEISHHFQKLFRLHGDFTLFCYEHLLFTWKTHCGLKFHFGQIYRCEICTEVSFTLPELMWVLIMKLPYTEVKFFHEVKSQICVSSLWVSCKCALKAGHTKTLHFYTLHIWLLIAFLLCSVHSTNIVKQWGLAWKNYTYLPLGTYKTSFDTSPPPKFLLLIYRKQINRVKNR